MIIAHGGSSSPGLYISRTGVAGAPYSGRKHPGRPASLKVAEDTNREPIMSPNKHWRKQQTHKSLSYASSFFGIRFNSAICLWPPTLRPYSSETRRVLNTISCRDMATHHQLWKLAAHFNNLGLKKKDPVCIWSWWPVWKYQQTATAMAFLESLSRTKGTYLGQRVSRLF